MAPISHSAMAASLHFSFPNMWCIYEFRHPWVAGVRHGGVSGGIPSSLAQGSEGGLMLGVPSWGPQKDSTVQPRIGIFEKILVYMPFFHFLKRNYV